MKFYKFYPHCLLLSERSAFIDSIGIFSVNAVCETNHGLEDERALKDCSSGRKLRVIFFHLWFVRSPRFLCQWLIVHEPSHSSRAFLPNKLLLFFVMVAQPFQRRFCKWKWKVPVPVSIWGKWRIFTIGYEGAKKIGDSDIKLKKGSTEIASSYGDGYSHAIANIGRPERT